MTLTLVLTATGINRTLSMGAIGSLFFGSRGEITGGCFSPPARISSWLGLLLPILAQGGGSWGALYFSIYTSALFIFFKSLFAPGDGGIYL